MGRRRVLAALSLVPVLLSSCGAQPGIPFLTASPTPVPERAVRVATTNRPASTWAGAQVSAAGRRLPLERRLSFELLPLNPTRPDIPPAVAAQFSVWPPLFVGQLATLAGAAAPDLVLVDSRWIAAFGQADLLMDLGPLLRGESWFDAAQYPGDVLGAGRVRGRQLALPLAAWVDALLYDQRAFQADGARLPRPDWLWADLLAAAQALTRRGRFGIALARDTSSPSLWTLAGQRGASLLNGDGTRVDLTQAGLLDALHFLADLIHRHRVARSPEADPPTLLESMAQRQAAMVGTVVGQSAFWRQPRFEGFALATWPTGDRPGVVGGFVGLAPLMVGISRGATHRDLSVEALGALAGAVAEGAPMPAHRRAAGTQPGPSDLLPSDDLAAMERARDGARFLPGDFPYFAVAQMLDEELLLPVLTGRKQPEQAAADAGPAINSRLAAFARQG